MRSLTLCLQQRRNLQALLLRAGYGVGKTTIARLLGQRACCRRQDLHPFEPCARCEGCEAVQRNPRQAYWEGYSEQDAQSVSPRDMIERIMGQIQCRKAGGDIMRQRVFTLDEFHRLPVRDQEKFVKVLEDWARRYETLFVLCVAPDAKICPAIAQRCTRRHLAVPMMQRAIRHLRLIARAEGSVLETAEAELLAATAECVPRAYLDLLQDAILLSENARITREAVLLACNNSQQFSVRE